MSDGAPLAELISKIFWEGQKKMKTCCQCSEPIKLCFTDDIKKALIENNWCFRCHFWEQITLKKDRPESVRAEGKHYFIGEEKPRFSEYAGFAGTYFKIRFFDGREITTHNLWTQGEIPEHFRERLPDNAEFK